MELRQFISKALLDVVGAVEDAQKKTPPGTIIPSDSATYKDIQIGLTSYQIIEFEVTVRADESAGSEAKLSVVSAFIGGSVKGDSDKSGGHAATLKFKIPVSLPFPNDKNQIVGQKT